VPESVGIGDGVADRLDGIGPVVPITGAAPVRWLQMPSPYTSRVPCFTDRVTIRGAVRLAAETQAVGTPARPWSTVRTVAGTVRTGAQAARTVPIEPTVTRWEPDPRPGSTTATVSMTAGRASPRVSASRAVRAASNMRVIAASVDTPSGSPAACTAAAAAAAGRSAAPRPATAVCASTTKRRCPVVSLPDATAERSAPPRTTRPAVPSTSVVSS
jgi:hypothetical protein